MKIASLKFSGKGKPSFADIKIDNDGNVYHYDKTGQLHRLDGPAVERADGTKRWHVKGMLHRLDGPAIEDSDGHKLWFANNKLHRLDGPAVEYANGDKSWWVNDELIGSSKDGFTQKKFEQWKRKRGL